MPKAVEQHSTCTTRRDPHVVPSDLRRVLFPQLKRDRRAEGVSSAHPCLTLRGEKGPVSLPTLRARLEAVAAEAIETAATAIEFLDELDARHADREPDHDGEAEPDEAGAQPVTLAPDWVRPKSGRAPTISEQYAEYCRVTGQAPSRGNVTDFPRRLRFVEVSA